MVSISNLTISNLRKISVILIYCDYTVYDWRRARSELVKIKRFFGIEIMSVNYVCEVVSNVLCSKKSCLKLWFNDWEVNEYLIRNSYNSSTSFYIIQIDEKVRFFYVTTSEAQLIGHTLSIAIITIALVSIPWLCQSNTN